MTVMQSQLQMRVVLHLQAYMAALETLDCSPQEGIVTMHNVAILYTAVKPH